MIELANMEVRELSISSKPENILEVEKFAEKLREEFDINDESFGNILVALTEAANNAIIHGNKSDEKKSVRIKLSVDGKNLTFYVTDEGDGFDFNYLPDPTAPENIEKPSGRGIFLMKHLADILSFRIMAAP